MGENPDISNMFTSQKQVQFVRSVKGKSKSAVVEGPGCNIWPHKSRSSPAQLGGQRMI